MEQRRRKGDEDDGDEGEDDDAAGVSEHVLSRQQAVWAGDARCPLQATTCQQHRRQQQLSSGEKNKTKKTDQRCDLGKTSTADETQRERLQRNNATLSAGRGQGRWRRLRPKFRAGRSRASSSSVVPSSSSRPAGGGAEPRSVRRVTCCCPAAAARCPRRRWWAWPGCRRGGRGRRRRRRPPPGWTCGPSRTLCRAAGDAQG